MASHAYFCGATAAVLMSIPLPRRHEESRVLHVAVPPPFRTPTGKNIRSHTFVSHPDHVGSWHGIRISSAEFTWCQLGAVLTLPDLVAAGDYLIHHRLPFTTAERLEVAVADYAGRRGNPALRAALPLLNDRSESRRESLLRVLVVTGERKVVIEYQSRFHDESKDFRADMTRISRLEADGWFVMQVNNDDLSNPRELAERIRTVLKVRPLMA